MISFLHPAPALSELPEHWRIRSSDHTSSIKILQESLHLQELTCHLLLARGLEDPQQARAFMEPLLRNLPDPRQMKGLERACQRIVQAIQRQERIVIYGDYDVDGVSSTSVLALFFREIGVPDDHVLTFIPHRIKHGYGLQSLCFDRLSQFHGQLLITVDCGISSRKEVDELNRMNFDVIVIDHHLPPEQLPDAYTILNPRQHDCRYPDKNLAAVGVTYQLVIGLRTMLREQGYFQSRPEPNLRLFLDLVALGTVADIVPLHGVNRILVYHGLQQMKQTRWPGIQALLEVSGALNHPISTQTIGFRLGPRINAAGRLSHASVGVRLLCSQDHDHAVEIAHALEKENTERKAMQEAIFHQTKQMLQEQPELQQEHAIVLGHETWHVGVIGIVASKLLEEYHRPVVLLAFDQEKGIAKGSARSIPSFHIYEAFAACQKMLDSFGGHKAAAGLTLSLKNYETFRSDFLALARRQISPQDIQPSLDCDALFDPDQLTLSLVQELQTLAPFGAENPAPLLVANDVFVSDQRKTKDGRHLQFAVGTQKIKAIAFSQSDQYPLSSRVNLAYRPFLSEWKGKRRIEIQVEEIA